jgi:hypothetical protein
MGRQKKIKTIQLDETTEVCMTDGAVLENILTEIDLARIELEKTKREIAEKKAESEKYQYTERPKRELSPDEKAIMDKHLGLSVEKKALAAKIEAQKAHDNQMITGKFLNLRAKGQAAKLCYDKHPGDIPQWITFQHGQVYTIKRGFADQINEYYHTPRFVQKEGPDDGSSQIDSVDTSDKKYAFVAIGY